MQTGRIHMLLLYVRSNIFITLHAILHARSFEQFALAVTSTQQMNLDGRLPLLSDTDINNNHAQHQDSALRSDANS